MHTFESLYKDVVIQGQTCIAVLKTSDIETLKLNLNHMISDIELMSNDANSLYESVRSKLGIWRARAESRKSFREEWHEFMSRARKVIQKTVEVEESFFPKLTGDFDDSLEIAESYQRSLNEFMPTVKVQFSCIIFHFFKRLPI